MEIVICLDGCPQECGYNGECVKVDDRYTCSCERGWKGTGCEIRVELDCSDNKDNDDGWSLFWLQFSLVNFIFCHSIKKFLIVRNEKELPLCLEMSIVCVCIILSRFSWGKFNSVDLRLTSRPWWHTHTASSTIMCYQLCLTSCYLASLCVKLAQREGEYWYNRCLSWHCFWLILGSQA